MMFHFLCRKSLADVPYLATARALDYNYHGKDVVNKISHQEKQVTFIGFRFTRL
jgi:hypothetical protein